jgi:hypothetical protein
MHRDALEEVKNDRRCTTKKKGGKIAALERKN